MPRRALVAAERNRRAVAVGILVLAGAVSVLNQARMIALGGDNYRTADWLINYAGGFVRRGLFGELILFLTPGGYATLWVLFVAQIALYVPVFWFVLRFLARSRWSWSAIALACGPLALPFIGWDPVGGFRKEIIALAALVVLAELRIRQPVPAIRWALVVGSLLLWTLGVFSWEPTALLLPGALYLVLSRDPWLPVPTPRRALVAGAFVAVSLIGLGLSVLWPGTPSQAAAVCESLRAAAIPTPDLCAGAVLEVGRGAPDGMAYAASMWPVYAGYPIVLAVGLLPILLSAWVRRNRLWAVAVAVAILPLYFVAIDYGRWGHIIFLSVAICVMSCGEEAARSDLWNPLSTLLMIGFAGVPNNNPLDGGLHWPLAGFLGTMVQLAQFGVFLTQR